MSHPLLSQLQTLSQLLTSHPQLASTPAAVKALDKVAADTQAAINLLQTASAAASPEVQELQKLLGQAFGADATEKGVKDLLKPLFDKIPIRKKGSPLKDYLELLAQATVKEKTTSAAALLVRKHLDAPRFDTSTKDEYKLLKQIRELGQMDASQLKAAKIYLANDPELVIRLCVAASIPTTSGKVRKPATTSSLITKLTKLGERYAENAGS